MKACAQALLLIAAPALAVTLLVGVTCRALSTDSPFPLMPSAPVESHLSVTHTHTFTVRLPLANAFTFFEPVGEKLWAEGWSPVFPTSDAAILSDNTIFTRSVSHHGQPTQTSIWMITRYDRPGGLIEYRTVVPGLRVSRITVRCRALRESETSVEVTYRHTSLSEDGDRFVAGITEEKFRASIDEWAAAIRAYLARGTAATP